MDQWDGEDMISGVVITHPSALWLDNSKIHKNKEIIFDGELHAVAKETKKFYNILVVWRSSRKKLVIVFGYDIIVKLRIVFASQQ